MALALLRLCRDAGVHLDGGRVAGLTCVNPNLTEPAIGIRSKDDVRPVGRAARARPYNIDRFLCDVEIIAQIPGTGLFDLLNRALRTSGRRALNRGLALHKLEAVIPRHPRNVRRVSFGCVAPFPCSGLRLFVDRVLDDCEVASRIRPENALVFAAYLTILRGHAFSDLAEFPAPCPI